MDEIYLKKVREGDTEAFSYFVEKYSDVSYSLAFGIVKNEQEAKDVVQNAYIKAFKAIGSYRNDSKFTTWFYRIVVNECHQRLRRFSLHRQFAEGKLKETAEFENEDKLLLKERKRILQHAISGLKKREALLIRLYYLCELSYEEIMDVTGLSRANVKVILHRARKYLKEVLEENFKDEFK